MNFINLNGIWNFAFYEGKLLEEVDPASLPDGLMSVPGCFDALPDHYCQRGCAVYSREFTLDQSWRKAWLKIDGMGLRSCFYLDGKKIGGCALPYSTFELELGSLEAGKHSLTALIDNNFHPEKMKLFLPNYDFYAFGGFYHGVALRLSEVDNPLDRIFVRTVDYVARRISLEFIFKGFRPDEFTAELSINHESWKEYTIRNGILELNREDLALWAPESPNLHTLQVRIGKDLCEETFGIREIRTSGKKIFLNGKELYLKGFNRHESYPGNGAATTLQEMMEDVQHLKSENANFVRGAHYPQSQEFLDLCDRAGILVWEESLGWGNNAKQLSDPEFIAQQIEQNRLMVRNSFNHPSVIIFAFLNENASGTDEGVAICRQLADTIRAEKSGRLVTFACSHVKTDRASEFMDIIAYNTYPGWICAESSPEKEPTEYIVPDMEEIVKRFRGLYGDTKPIIVSEMGVCALYGQHDLANAQWSEEFQAELLGAIADAVMGSDEISGLIFWQFNDAKSFHRKGSILRVKPLSQNLAGIYDQYRRPKLAAQVVAEKFAQKPSM